MSVLKEKVQTYRLTGWLGLVVAVFFSVTWVDFVVNDVLYSYGLAFSWGWFQLYQAGLAAIIISISGLVAWQSWQDTGIRHVALQRGSIIFLAYYGGLIDWIFFLVYSGRVNQGEWTWMWQYNFFGTWNWKLQALWSLCFLTLIIVMWKIHPFTGRKRAEQPERNTPVVLGKLIERRAR